MAVLRFTTFLALRHVRDTEGCARMLRDIQPRIGALAPLAVHLAYRLKFLLRVHAPS